MEKQNGRLLFIIDSFPPDKGGRVEKIVRRIKFLSKSGWQIQALAPKSDKPDEYSDFQSHYPNLQVARTNYLLRNKYPSLRHNKNRNISVGQGKNGNFLDFLFVPKGFIRWLPFGIYHGIKLARQSDVILSINNPIVPQLVGLIVSRITRKPWIVELRDPIAGYAYSMRGPERLNRWMERIIFNNATKIIQFEDSMPLPMATRYPHIDSSRFVSIEYMGYDKDDFETFAPLKVEDYKKKLAIVYTGSFYGETITPIPFLKGLYKFLQKEPSAKEQIVVNFAGDWSTEYDATIDELGLSDIVQYHGYISREACLSMWNDNHVQLLILGKEADNVDRIPSKFYDYIGSQRSIFALVHPEGKVARLVREKELGFVADTEDITGIAHQISLMYSKYKKNALTINDESNFRQEIISDNSEQVIADVLQSVIE